MFEVIRIDVGRLFHLVVDTGDPWFDAGTAIAVVGILVWALVVFRTKKAKSQSKTRKAN
jgi:hypothetical protein